MDNTVSFFPQMAHHSLCSESNFAFLTWEENLNHSQQFIPAILINYLTTHGFRSHGSVSRFHVACNYVASRSMYFQEAILFHELNLTIESHQLS